MKRTYKFFWIILIALIPLLPSSGWNFSIDVSDVGFNMNQYRFCFTDMDSTYLPLFLTNILGGCLLKVFGILHIPAYIGMETAGGSLLLPVFLILQALCEIPGRCADPSGTCVCHGACKM